jgi:hypothetical protein
MFTRPVQSILLFFAVLATTSLARAESLPDLGRDIATTIQSLQQTEWEPTISGSRQALILGDRITLDECQSYPYHENSRGYEGFNRLAADLVSGLRQGLQCMAGNGPMGRLHPYHEANARRLVDLLNDDSGKILSCVEDQTFAYAIAYPAKIPGAANEILIDTYRISGFLSRKFERATYRDFFKLSESLIEDHLTGKPLHLDGMHRYRNLPALMFHEVSHWLGYEHTNLTADVVDLYEACCFGGSDHILNSALNTAFQARACNILKDAELWESDEKARKRQWRKKGYFRLKRDIRQAKG